MPSLLADPVDRLGHTRGQLPGNALGIVGLSGHEDTLARQLSAGQKKRLSLARLWLAPAPLWLLDEPYANLDLDGINLVNRMVQAHLRDGGAALLTTHCYYAEPPVRTLMLELGGGSRPADVLSASAASSAAGAGNPKAMG